MHEIPALIVACFDYPEKVEGLGVYRSAGSVWPGIQNLLLTARALGLGASPTTLALRDQDAVREILKLPETFAALCLIPVGHPMGNFGPVSQKAPWKLCVSIAGTRRLRLYCFYWNRRPSASSWKMRRHITMNRRPKNADRIRRGGRCATSPEAHRHRSACGSPPHPTHPHRSSHGSRRTPRCVTSGGAP